MPYHHRSVSLYLKRRVLVKLKHALVTYVQNDSDLKNVNV